MDPNSTCLQVLEASQELTSLQSMAGPAGISAVAATITASIAAAQYLNNRRLQGRLRDQQELEFLRFFTMAKEAHAAFSFVEQALNTMRDGLMPALTNEAQLRLAADLAEKLGRAWAASRGIVRGAVLVMAQQHMQLTAKQVQQLKSDETLWGFLKEEVQALIPETKADP